MNNSLSPPALKRHTSRGDPFGTSRLSSAFNSSTGNCWGQAAGRELNSAGKQAECGQWPPIQVGVLNLIGKDS